MPAITTEGLVRSFEGVPAVDGLDLDIRQGEIYGFLGPNGAGKSTTVRVLCTLLAPTAGRATVAGHDVATEPGQVRLRIGAALQEAALDPRQTGEELLRLQGTLYGLTRREVEQRLSELTELVDIGDALRRPISTYSGGMRRRLDLAVALDSAGIALRDLTLRTPTLDDVFLEATGTHIRPDEGSYDETEEVTL